MKFYEAVFAPCAATRRDVIRVAQLVHDDGKSVYEAFAPERSAAGAGGHRRPDRPRRDEAGWHRHGYRRLWRLAERKLHVGQPSC